MQQVSSGCTGCRHPLPLDQGKGDRATRTLLSFSVLGNPEKASPITTSLASLPRTSVGASVLRTRGPQCKVQLKGHNSHTVRSSEAGRGLPPVPFAHAVMEPGGAAATLL